MRQQNFHYTLAPPVHHQARALLFHEVNLLQKPATVDKNKIEAMILPATCGSNGGARPVAVRMQGSIFLCLLLTVVFSPTND
jgi:hypothetical protein